MTTMSHESPDAACHRIGRVVTARTYQRKLQHGAFTGTELQNDVQNELQRLGITGFSQDALTEAIFTGISDANDPTRGHEPISTQCTACGDTAVVSLDELTAANYSWMCGPCTEVDTGDFPFGEEAHPDMVPAFHQLDAIHARHPAYCEDQVWNDMYKRLDTETRWNTEFLRLKDQIQLSPALLDEWGDDSLEYIHYWWKSEIDSGVWERYKATKALPSTLSRT